MSDTTLEITASQFATLVRPVIPLVSDDFTPILNSVRIQTHGKYVIAMATDRFRLGIHRIKLETAPPAAFEATIRLSELKRILSIFKPTRTVDSILTLTIEADDLIRVNQSGGFGFIDASMTFRIERGEYPDSRRVINAALAETDEKSTETAFNPSYLASFKNAPRERNVPLVIHSSAPGKATVISAGDDFIGAIMPVRLASGAAPEVVDGWAGFLTSAKPVKPRAKATSKKAEAAA